MVWAIEHYGYYLNGRKFTVITDHQSLKAMKNKPNFGSLKLERMREHLQAFDFEIKYQKGETITDADALSRLNEEPIKYSDSEKRNKNVIIDSEGRWFWKISGTEIRIFPEITERIPLIKKTH